MKIINYFIFITLYIFLTNSAYSQEKDRDNFKGEDYQEIRLLFNTKNIIEKSSNLDQKATEISTNETAQESPTLILKPQRIKISAPKPFIAAHTLWQGTNLYRNNIVLHYRISKNGRNWSHWKESKFDGHFEENGRKLASVMEFLEVDIQYIQYKVTFLGKQKITITQTTLGQYSPGDTPEEIKTIIQESGNQIAKASCSKPTVISRSQWGARNPASSFPTTIATHLIVHHELGPNSSSDWAARVRSVQNFHMNTRGWSDIGYNFLISPTGTIYEGRAGGDRAQGAHFCGKNAKTMGVCLLGDYSNSGTKPTTNAQTSLKKILAWKANKENINPTGASYHYSINASLKNIAGHRDGGASCSSCPGNGGYSILGSIRTGVSNLIANDCGGGGSDTTVPTTSISASGGNTQSGDFTANFSDNDNVGVTRRFYQALEKYEDNWYANRGNGFFNDNFNVLYSGYTTGAGNWNINDKHLRQSNTSSDNTKLSTYLSQNSGLPYLYEFSAKTVSTSGARKFGIHIMASDATQSQRGNSYLIWFSGEDNKVRVYETINNNLNFRAIADVSLDNKWANYKITYSPGFGVLEVFRNNKSILKWTDSSPIKNGSSISLRTNTTIVEFDDLKVYKFRATGSQGISAGTAVTKDIRRRNGKVKSLVRDAAGNWSTPGNLDVTISTLTKENQGLQDDTFATQLDMIIYPNPTDGTNIFLTYQAQANTTSNISILDITGRVLRSFNETDKESGSKSIPLDQYFLPLQSGQYFIKMRNGKNSYISTLIKN
ncbi:N-acetylmuramoyl-L-alanine amidase [uncultured Aquimarina sp.]|uniref:N-acetylmuramoyl-L-alanine amidase n=1 Tax=uncultured Aquimarina sp. TaxID=575652 RepID=UPI00262C586B|nr:N-acetylmuramoyl-L-alanine amidase [uncultured Aquimarina sp.]